MEPISSIVLKEVIEKHFLGLFMKINVKWDSMTSKPVHYTRVEETNYQYLRVYIPYGFSYGTEMLGHYLIQPWIKDRFDELPLIMSFYA